MGLYVMHFKEIWDAMVFHFDHRTFAFRANLRSRNAKMQSCKSDGAVLLSHLRNFPSTFLITFSESRLIAEVLEIVKGTLTEVIVEGGAFSVYSQ